MDNWCNKCKQPKDSDRHRRHRESASRAQKKTKDARRRAGLCQGCGYKLGTAEHQKICNDTTRERIRKLTADGKCRKHHRREAIVKGFCEACWFSNVAIRTLGSHTRRHSIRDLFILQNGRCAYTGRKLVLGKNTSLDHKQPKWRGGTDEDTNLHWVDTQINIRYKNCLTHQNFLDLCKATWSRREDGEKLDEFDRTLAGIWEHQLGKSDNRDRPARKGGESRKVGASTDRVVDNDHRE